MIDIEKYDGRYLHDRRSENGLKWSLVEQERDLPLILKMRTNGHTFDEIALKLNSERTYIVTARQIQYYYNTRMKEIELINNSDEALEEARNTILEELRWVKGEALRKWQELKVINFTEEVQRKVDRTEDEDEDSEAKPPVKAFSIKKQGLIEQTSAKWLEIVMNCVKLEATYLGVGNVEIKDDMVLIMSLKNKVLDDGQRASMPPITSEEQLLETIELEEYLPAFRITDGEEE